MKSQKTGKCHEIAEEHITYTTNRRFKGLESDVIIFLRIEQKHKNDLTKLDYVTVSRVKGLCYVFNLVET